MLTSLASVIVAVVVLAAVLLTEDKVRKVEERKYKRGNDGV